MAPAQAVFIPCGPGVYALQAEGADAAYGWVGYALGAQDQPPANQPITLSDAFNRYQGSYLFASAMPGTAGMNGLQANIRAFLRQIDQSAARGLIWLPDPTLANPLPGNAPGRFAITFLRSLSGIQAVGNFSLWLGPNNGFTFSVGQNSQIGWSDANQAVTFSGKTGYSYIDPLSGIPGNAGLLVQSNPTGDDVDMIVPLTGPRAGAFVLTTRMTPSTTFPTLQPGVGFWANAAGSDIAARFPVLDAATVDPAASVLLATVLDALDPLNLALPTTGPVTLDGGQLRTGFAVTGIAPAWTSWFRTLDGRAIALTPLEGESVGAFDGPPDHGGGFAFMAQHAGTGTPAPNAGAFLLTLAGDYGLATEGMTPGCAGQTLLPGLFGSERFNFTGWNPDQPGAGSRLRFLTAQPAYAPIFPFPAATMTNLDHGMVAAQRLTGTYRTAWASLIGPSPLYQAEPDGGAYYGGAPLGAAGSDGTGSGGTPLLGSTAPATSVPQQPGYSVPIAPYAAYVPDPTGWSAASGTASAVGAFESQILSATRKTILGGASSAARAARALRRERRLAADGIGDAPAGSWTTTRQGLLAQVAATEGATDLLAVALAQYQPRDGGSLATLGFTAPTATLQDALQTSQLFAVAVNAEPLASFSQTLDIADWQFDVAVGEGVRPIDYSNILLLKYCDGPLIDWARNPNTWVDPLEFSLLSGMDPAFGYTSVSTWLVAYLEAAIASSRTSPLYANIAAIATQADWRGFLALRASLPPASALPPQIAGLAAGIDPGRLYAHHFGATLSRVTLAPDPGTGAPPTAALTIDGVSSLFGLIDYQDPLYLASIAAGNDPDTPLAIDTDDAFGFRVLNLQALFVNARMTSFESRIQLSINELFGAPVTAARRAAPDAGYNPVDPTFPDAWRAPAGNGVVLAGSAVSQNGKTAYVFRQTRPVLFTIDTPALNAITLSRVQFDTLGVSDDIWPSGTVPTITSRFLLWGTFDFPLLDAPVSTPTGDGSIGYDILSFGSQAGAPPGPGLAYSNLQLTMRSPLATPTQSAFAFDPSNIAFDLGASTPRPSSLFSSMALQLQSFIAAPDGATPLDHGFLTVAPEGPTLAALIGGWYGIVYKVNMGGPGTLVADAGFSSQLLVAWSPIAGTPPALFVGISLPGAAPGASMFSLQGVIDVTTGPITLLQPVAGQFSIRLADIGVTFLGVKKIPDGTIHFFLFGDPGGGSLGWYAAYNPASGAIAAAGDVASIAARSEVVR